MQFHSAWICFFRELDDDSGCESDASHNASSEEEPNNIPQKKRSKRYNGPKFEELAVRYYFKIPCYLANVINTILVKTFDNNIS